MARLGHSSVRAAMIYQHATKDRDQAIAKALGGWSARSGEPRMSSRNAGSGTHDLSAVWHVCRTNCAPGLCPIKLEGGGTYPDLPLCDGAGEGNRTLMPSLEGFGCNAS